MDTAAGTGNGRFAVRPHQRFFKETGGNRDARNLPVLAGAGEALRLACMEDHVQHGRFEGGVGTVAMGFPIGGPEVEFDRPFAPLAGDLDGGLQEIRSGRAVPLAELYDAHRISRRVAEVPAEGSGEPQRLQLELGRKGDAGGLREGGHAVHAL